MADEQAPAAVAEAPAEQAAPPAPTPTPTPTAPDAGEGLRETIAAQERELVRSSQAAAEAQALASTAMADAEAARLRANEPDPVLDPEGNRRYWQQAHEYERQQRQQAVNERNTEREIMAALLSFAKRTGIVVTREDSRLRANAGDRAGFYSSLSQIEKDVKEAATRQARQEELIEAEVQKRIGKKLAESGADTFDAGQGSSDAGLTVEKYQSMGFEARQKLRRESPEKISAMMAAAAKGGR